MVLVEGDKTPTLFHNPPPPFLDFSPSALAKADFEKFMRGLDDQIEAGRRAKEYQVSAGTEQGDSYPKAGRRKGKQGATPPLVSSATMQDLSSPLNRLNFWGPVADTIPLKK